MPRTRLAGIAPMAHLRNASQSPYSRPSFRIHEIFSHAGAFLEVIFHARARREHLDYEHS